MAYEPGGAGLRLHGCCVVGWTKLCLGWDSVGMLVYDLFVDIYAVYVQLSVGGGVEITVLYYGV